MDIGTFFIVAVVLFAGLFFFEQIKRKNQIYCTFRRRNRTRIEKWVRQRSNYVIFDGGRYAVNPKRIQLLWWNRGVLGLFGLGFWVPSLDFRHDTSQALDPDTFEPTWDTPEARNMLASEDDFKEFAKGAQPLGTKKEGTLQRLLPWIMIGALVVIAFWVYQLQGQMAGLIELAKVKGGL